MAKVFYFSKKFSEQGPPVSDVSMSDLFTLSRTVDVTPKYKLGFRTYGSTLTRLKDYDIHQLTVNGVPNNARFGAGLLGRGTEQSPLAVDAAWVSENYIPVGVWAYTQVGDPSDFTLPISGSYFSVSYPYTNDQLPPTAIVEGNGDMRVLRHVTNGEDLRVVYSTWKNYQATPISSMVLTDTVYHPPGLAAGEFIRNVLPASGTAMLGEVHTTAGFKEHVFIILNDTAIADFHKIIRLGTQLSTVLMGKTHSTATLQQMRSMGVMSAVIRGRNYVGMVMAPNSEGTGIQQQLAFAEVSTTGTMTRIKNWTATNSQGLTRTDENFAILNQKISTTDPSDKDGVFFAGPGVGINATSSSTGTSPFNRATWVDAGDGKNLVMCLYNYGSLGTAIQSGAAKAQWYYVIDMEGRKVTPEAKTGYDRRPSFIIGPTGYVVRSTKNSITKIYERDGHYWAQGRNFQLLPTGDRMYWSVGSTDVAYIARIYRGTAKTGLEAADDNHFVAERAENKDLNALPPTPFISGQQATLVHDNMVIINVDKIATYTTQGFYGKMQGSQTAKTYSLLQANSFLPRIPYKGYALNNSRFVLNNGLYLNINSIRRNGKVYYHNAMWSPGTPQTDKFAARIDANLNTNGTYSCDPAVYAAMNAYIERIPVPTGFQEMHSWDWLIVPPYPGIGYDYAIVKFLYSHRIRDAADARGYRYTGTKAQYGLIPAKYRVDSLGNVTLESLDLTKLQDQWITLTSSYNIGRVRSHQRGASAVDVDSDKVYVILRGGGSSGSHYGSDHAAWQCRGFVCNPDGTDLVNHSGSVNYIDQPLVHATHGLGIITNYGLGTYYVFVPILKPSFRVDTDPNNVRVLTSARPAAGFNLSVSSPISIYVNGVSYYIPIQTRNLMDVSSAYKNTTFYCYATIFNGEADLLISKTVREETLNQIFLGTITTSETEITNIDCRPVTRWDVSRPSVYPIGNAIPVSTGLPNDNDVRVWENVTTLAGTPHEYLWGMDDIIDTEGKRTIDSVYWSNYADGSDTISTTEYGDDMYLIVKTTGIDGNVSVSFDRADLNGVDFAHGTIDGVINVPITYNAAANQGFGSIRLRTWEIDEMAFKNATWSVRSDRVLGSTYTNNTDFEIAVSIKVLCEQNNRALALDVDGMVIDSFNAYGDFWKSTLKVERTLQAIVPSKSTYRLYNTIGTGGLVQWSELRRG